MSSLLVTKEYIKQIYAKNQAYIDPVLKFMLAMIVFMLINAKVGYMERIDSMTIVLVAALFCSFMPLKTIAFIGAAFMLLHYYALSLECAIVVLAMYLVMFLLFLRFAPKETLVVLLTPILFALKVPYVVPVAMGLFGGPASIVSVTFGVIISYLVEYTEMNASTITSMGSETMMSKLRFVLDGLIANKAMIVTIAAFAITLLLVYTIRRMSMDYSWTVAMIVGILADVVILLMGDLIMDLNYNILGIILGSVVAGCICFILQFLFFNLDYRRTENVQFEDDEYYYYVKAVPKITVSTPDKKVKKINSKKGTPVRSSHNQVPTSIKTAHGVARSSSGTVRTAGTDKGVKKTAKD